MHVATKASDAVSVDNGTTGSAERERGCENTGVVPLWAQRAQVRGTTTANWDRRSLHDWQIETDWRSRGDTREEWDARQHELRENWRRIDVAHGHNRPGAKFCYGIEHAESAEPPSVPLEVQSELCNKRRGARLKDERGHRTAGAFACRNAHHEDCLSRDLLRLRFGVTETENAGHPAIMMALGFRLSIFRFEGPPCPVPELKREQKRLGDRIGRWTRGQRLNGAAVHHRGDRIERAGDGLARPVRYILASEDADAGRYPKRRHAPALVARGETTEIVMEYVRLVGSAWSVDVWTESEATQLLNMLTGARRIGCSRGFRQVLDLVELRHRCPRCGLGLSFVGWLTVEYSAIWHPEDGGYWTWGRGPPPEELGLAA